VNGRSKKRPHLAHDLEKIWLTTLDSRRKFAEAFTPDTGDYFRTPDDKQWTRSELPSRVSSGRLVWTAHDLKTTELRGGLMGDRATAVAGPQHLKALERANQVRLARAAMKRQVAAGERSAAEVIMASPWEAESMSVSELLMSQRRWGRTRCRRVLLTLGLPENKQIGTMTERQRTALAAMLSAKVGAPRPERAQESRPRALTLSPV
jgi:hypothetical protein